MGLIQSTPTTPVEWHAARSLALWHRWPKGNNMTQTPVVYSEVKVEQSFPGTYAMAIGFKGGYLGIQRQLPGRDSNILFAIWDPGDEQKDPGAKPMQEQVEVLTIGEGVNIEPFDGEGTGRHAVLVYPWQDGETCCFKVSATTDGDTTTYTGYFSFEREWKILASFRVKTGGRLLTGLCSFLEDFARTESSEREDHRAAFLNIWALSAQNTWLQLTEAFFSADRHSTGAAANKFNLQVIPGGYLLDTGGTDVVDTVPLNSRVECPASETVPIFN